MFFKKKKSWFKVVPKKAKVGGDKETYKANMAKERIDKLFEEAEAAANSGNLSQATRYVMLARKLAMKHNLKLTPDQKKKFCHACYTYVMPGKTLTVRVNPDYQAVEYICQNCGKVTRYGYREEKGEKTLKSDKSEETA